MMKNTKDSVEKKKALKIIEVLDIMDYLNSIGDARVVGSVALDVIVKKDIDIHIVVKDIFETIDVLYKKLIQNALISDVKIKDFSIRNGMLVGIDQFVYEEETWSLDFWITTDPNTTAFKDTDKYLEIMTDENRDLIIKIKKELIKNYNGTSGGISTIIYKAVLLEGIESVEEYTNKYLN